MPRPGCIVQWVPGLQNHSLGNEFVHAVNHVGRGQIAKAHAAWRKFRKNGETVVDDLPGFGPVLNGDKSWMVLDVVLETLTTFVDLQWQGAAAHLQVFNNKDFWIAKYLSGPSRQNARPGIPGLASCQEGPGLPALHYHGFSSILTQLLESVVHPWISGILYGSKGCKPAPSEGSFATRSKAFFDKMQEPHAGQPHMQCQRHTILRRE